MQLQISEENIGPQAILFTLVGRLMLGPEGAELENVVKNALAAGTRKIIFEMSGLKHIDSTGIGRCIACLSAIQQAGGSLAMAGATGQVRVGFRMTQLDKVFRFYDDLASAKSALGL